MLSKLSVYSIGIVTKDKKENESTIYALPYEVITDLDGTISNYRESIDSAVPELKGNPFNTITKVSEIRCEWLPFGDLRTSAPDIVLGEQVIIWRYGDTQDFYWTPKRQDLLNRKLEHIILTLSNTKDDQSEAEPYKNAYTITLSTRDGMLSIETDDNNKEKAKYLYLMDTKNGVVSLSDNHDNLWKLDSPNRKLTVVTAEVLYDCKTFKVTGTLDVLKVSTFHDNVYGKKLLNIKGNATFESNASINGSTAIKGTLTGSVGATFGGTVNASHFVGAPGSVKYR